MKEKRAPDSIRWTLDKKGNPIQVNVWTSSHYRHGSDWDYEHYVEDLEGNLIERNSYGRLENQSKEEEKYNWENVYGYKSLEEALKSKK